MTRTELPQLRTRTSKTFDNGDGTRTYEVGCHAHHQSGGLWVETDCTLSDSGTEWTPARHPHDVRIPKNVNVAARCGSVTIRPLNVSKPPAKVTASGSGVVYEQTWDGIDLRRIVSPEGLVTELAVTSAAGQTTVQFAIDGTTGVGDGVAVWQSGMEHGLVPWTLTSGTLSLDLSAVPVGAVVR